MNWMEAEIFTSTDGLDIITDTLTNLGVSGFVIKDAEDFKGFLADSKGQWDYIDEGLMELTEYESSVTVYLPDNNQGKEQLNGIRAELTRLRQGDGKNLLGRLELVMKNVREEDWANNWKQYFKPFSAGSKLIIKPSWEEVTNTDGRLILEIDPASSFGTGQHATTRLCLELMEEYVVPGKPMLDLGCGSGILTIGGLLLGASEAFATDIAENAVATTMENAAKNGFNQNRCHAFFGDVISDSSLAAKLEGPYPLITANIVADVLSALLYEGLFQRFLAPVGFAILSGIIDLRAQDVEKAVEENGFTIIKRKDSENWVALVIARNSM